MKQLFKSKKITILFGSAFIVVLILIIGFMLNSIRPIGVNEYELFLSQEQINSATIKSNKIILHTKNGDFSILKNVIDLPALAKKVPIDEIESDSGGFLTSLIFILIFLLVFILILKKTNNNLPTSIKMPISQENQPQNSILPTTSNVSFSDVAGIEEVKEELLEIVDFLKNSKPYKQYGINLPKGVLLVGPPGVGKTLVAKAIAGEAGVPFFYQSGANFVQIYVGMGAKRVSELFSHAKANAPSIVFIDEIDAVGKARGGHRNDEREATLNQLLTEMDGFEDSSGVIVIAATNKIELIDEALLRSGRFDRRVFLQLPDFHDRMSILNLYLKNKQTNVNVEDIAKITVGFSGAALANLVNEAAILALRKKADLIDYNDFYNARDKVVLGKKKILHFSDSEKDIQSSYQAAKALSAFWFEVEFDKILILGDGLKGVDRQIESKTQMNSKIKVYLAGIAISQMLYGEIFTNARNDLNEARKLAIMMVEQFGMGSNLMPMPNDVDEILQNELKEVSKFLSDMINTILKIKQKLIENESITKEEIRLIVHEDY